MVTATCNIWYSFNALCAYDMSVIKYAPPLCNRQFEVQPCNMCTANTYAPRRFVRQIAACKVDPNLKSKDMRTHFCVNLHHCFWDVKLITKLRTSDIESLCVNYFAQVDRNTATVQSVNFV
jgi:hypothetical protein